MKYVSRGRVKKQKANALPGLKMDYAKPTGPKSQEKSAVTIHALTSICYVQNGPNTITAVLIPCIWQKRAQILANLKDAS
ncbi:hypothetical protein T4E_8386 [Trichinella pseudospiralis]|uniref:Uncharacterized protein n=1 Tax=Trichinella pseudospiralis TaxID=6337 RepID=A0A0V0XTR4_TRIPS|nr:hypothetical protein T4E_8386 [Trichinella pseudospiralis]